VFGALHGVIHAAGHAGERAAVPISDLTPHDIDAQWNAKVRGLHVLRRVLDGVPLDFCVLCSSLATVAGGVGFGAYAAANAYMDSFVRQPGLERWSSVAWDGWRFDEDGAMASYGAAWLDALALTPAEGASVIERVLHLPGGAVTIVSTADLTARLQHQQQVRETRVAASTTLAAEHPRPSIARDFEPPEGALEQQIAGIWQEVLGISPIGRHDDFFELGGNSLLAVQVVTRLRQQVDAQMTMKAFFDTLSVASLADQLSATEVRVPQGATSAVG
jgi:phthiocerol/phenolphthiocerol synthesis type-I polyketide synthase E